MGRKRLRVLVVEDREPDAELVVGRLRNAGYDVDWVRVQTAETMRAALARGAWDAIVSDFQMPGFDAFGAIRVSRESGLDLPFIVVSGTIGEDTAVEAMRAGAHDYFLKGHLTRLPAAIDREIGEAEHRRSERALLEELRYRAMHDPLTGLPNRAALLEALGSVLRADAGRPVCALLLADLDSFKAINEALGREAGDEILRQTAARLRDGAGEIGFAAHLGADEFALMLRSRGATAAERTAARMLRGLDRPFSVQGQSVAAAASIGIAVSPDHGTDAELLLRRAEIAMHSAKRSGSTFAMYSPALEEHTAERLGLVGQLRGAIERDELVLHYQRQVELASMRTIGYEALVRWQHPERGLLSPAMFVPLAERLGLSRVLFEWSLRTALSEGGALGVDAGIALALNLSVRNLLDADLPGLVEKALRDAGREPGSLCLEVTEQGVMAEPERAIKVLERLRAIGLKVSIDDFGTGYSSMAYLQRLPADELKIDQTFLRDIPNDRRNVAIVRATIDLARGLGIAALAEGVEDEETLAALVTLGCDRAQGFHLGRPAPAPALDRAGTA